MMNKSVSLHVINHFGTTLLLGFAFIISFLFIFFSLLSNNKNEQTRNTIENQDSIASNCQHQVFIYNEDIGSNISYCFSFSQNNEEKNALVHIQYDDGILELPTTLSFDSSPQIVNIVQNINNEAQIILEYKLVDYTTGFISIDINSNETKTFTNPKNNTFYSFSAWIDENTILLSGKPVCVDIGAEPRCKYLRIHPEFTQYYELKLKDFSIEKIP